MLKCEKCIHKTVCIDGANHKNAEACRNFVNEKDFLPVKHGEWRSWEIEKQISYDVIRPYRYYSCSVCDMRSAIRSNYCPNCGAKMDGGNDNASKTTY